jgi:hypothetical protein
LPKIKSGKIERSANPGGVNLSIISSMSRIGLGKFFLICRVGFVPFAVKSLFTMFSRFFLGVFAVENVPFTTTDRDVTRKRQDFLPNDLIELIFELKKIMQDLLGFGEGAAFVRERAEPSAAQSVHNQVGEMGNPVLR